MLVLRTVIIFMHHVFPSLHLAASQLLFVSHNMHAHLSSISPRLLTTAQPSQHQVRAWPRRQQPSSRNMSVSHIATHDHEAEGTHLACPIATRVVSARSSSKAASRLSNRSRDSSHASSTSSSSRCAKLDRGEHRIWDASAHWDHGSCAIGREGHSAAHGR